MTNGSGSASAAAVMRRAADLGGATQYRCPVRPSDAHLDLGIGQSELTEHNVRFFSFTHVPGVSGSLAVISVVHKCKRSTEFLCLQMGEVTCSNRSVSE